MSSHTPTPEEAWAAIVTQPAVTLSLACAGLGISQATGSRALAKGAFPVPIIRMGTRVIIPTQPLRELLHLDAGSSHQDQPEGRGRKPTAEAEA